VGSRGRASATVDREVVASEPVRVRYSLTPGGRGLRPAVEALHEWGETSLGEASNPAESVI
jgi:DNA-binding HxlR family transcriptional regulator